MKYRILKDYGTEGFKFEDGEFDSINVAVHHAVKTASGIPWQIVSLVEWRAEYYSGE